MVFLSCATKTVAQHVCLELDRITIPHWNNETERVTMKLLEMSTLKGLLSPFSTLMSSPGHYKLSIIWFPAGSFNSSNSSSSICSDYPICGPFVGPSVSNPTFLAGSKPRIGLLNLLGTHLFWCLDQHFWMCFLGNKWIQRTILSLNNVHPIPIKWSLCAIMSHDWKCLREDPFSQFMGIDEGM